MATILGLILAASTTLSAVLGAQSWMGGHPSAAGIRGKVVLLDVFTVDCINCQHVVPELRKLDATLPRSDFQIIGLHTPETPYERDPAHVSQSLRAQGITWPVAVDNDGAVWNAYGLQYWPTQMIFDRRGRLRKVVIGEGQDEVVRRTVLQLIHEDQATLPNERIYRLAIHGKPNSEVAVNTDGPAGWIQTLCTARVCAIRRATMRIDGKGISLALLHVYRATSVSPLAGVVRVTVSGAVHQRTQRYVRF